MDGLKAVCLIFFISIFSMANSTLLPDYNKHESYYLDGFPMMVSNLDKSAVQLVLEKPNGSIFHVYIKNKTDQLLPVSYDSFEFISGVDNTSEKVLSVINPEALISNKESEITKKESELNKRSNLNNSIGIFSNIFSNVIKYKVEDISGKKIKEDNVSNLERKIENENYKRRMNESRQQLKDARENLAEFKDELLIKTTVFPGKEVDGDVMIKLDTQFMENLIVKVSLFDDVHYFYLEHQH